MPYQLPPDLDHRIQTYLSAGGFQNEDDVLRSALDALEEREQEKLRHWHDGNRIAIEQSQQGLSKPLDDEAVIARLRAACQRRNYRVMPRTVWTPRAESELDDILFQIAIRAGRPETGIKNYFEIRSFVDEYGAMMLPDTSIRFVLKIGFTAGISVGSSSTDSTMPESK